jgi:hypothetical protein
LCIHIQNDSGVKVNNLGGYSVSQCEKKSSYEHVSNSEWFKSPDLTPFQCSLWGWMKSAFHYSKVDKQDKLLVCILDAVACINTREDQQYMIFTNEL